MELILAIVLIWLWRQLVKMARDLGDTAPPNQGASRQFYEFEKN